MSETPKPNVLDAFRQIAALIRLVLDAEGTFHEDSDGWSRSSRQWSDRYRDAFEKVQRLMAQATAEGLTEAQASALAQTAGELCKEIEGTIEGNRVQLATERRRGDALSAAYRRLEHAKRHHSDVEGITVDYTPTQTLMDQAHDFFEKNNEAAAIKRLGKVAATIQHCAGHARAKLYRQKLDALHREHGTQIDTPEVLEALRRSVEFAPTNDGLAECSFAKKALKLAERQVKQIAQ